jgi:Domain of unknown function (DUF6898)
MSDWQRSNRLAEDGYLIEYIPRGRYIKVSAIDPHTGTEVSIVGDKKASQKELNRIVLQKLDYVLKQRGRR